MKKAILLSLLLYFLTMNAYCEDDKKLYKIEIIKSSNFVIKDDYLHLLYPEKIDSPEYKELKEYVLKNIQTDPSKDPEFIIEVLDWVGHQWKHNGFNEAPESMTSMEILQRARKGEQFRCVEYGKVLKDILLAFGYLSRTVALKTSSAPYGGLGQGHVATEVWSNSLRKWIFVDPQFSIYVKHRGSFLNYYEIYELKKDGKFNEIEFFLTKKFNEKKEIDDYVDNYRKFISRYMGSIDMSYRLGEKTVRLVLMMEGKNNFLTFQGLPYNNAIFTSDVRDLYFDLNRSIIFFTYRDNQTLKDLSKDITTNEDYLKKMPLFAAKPDFIINFQNNMPWFDYYELSINGTVVTVKEKEYSLSLREGLNEIQVVGINRAGLKGIPSDITIKYDKD